MALMLKLDPGHPDSDMLREVITALGDRKTVAFPTETFYALGVSAYCEAAIRKVFSIKGREQDKPLPILIEGRAMLKEVAEEIPEVADTLIDSFWPGGLTLILKASKKIPRLLTANTDTVAVRNSSHPLARMLVAGAGYPLTATSANRSGHKGCSSASEVEEGLGKTVDLIVDGGHTAGLLPSTIIDLTSTPPRIVREGVISRKRLKAFLIPE